MMRMRIRMRIMMRMSRMRMKMRVRMRMMMRMRKFLKIIAQFFSLSLFFVCVGLIKTMLNTFAWLTI